MPKQSSVESKRNAWAPRWPLRALRACCVIGASAVFAPAHADPFLPSFGDAVFTGQAPDNPFFPMTGSTPQAYSGSYIDEDGELVTERFELTNLGTGPVLLGVQTFTQQDLAYEDGVLVEGTRDYYAQDTHGNVWYFGEDVTNYQYDDDGVLIGTSNNSSWLAGVNDALPGFIMPVDLTPGFEYKQEFAPADNAVDEARIWAVDQTVTIGVGEFTGVLQILETNPLNPDSREFKYYAPGIGLILVDEGLDEAFMNPAFSVELQPQAVPEPGVLPLLGLGVACLCWRRQRVPIREGRARRLA